MTCASIRVASRLIALAVLAGACCLAQAQDVDRFAGQWKVRLTWGWLVDDTGTVSARRAGDGIEMTCTAGCNASSFLRSRPQGGALAWEFWAEAGMQSKCKEDRGWRPVEPIISPDGRHIDFFYVMRESDSCGALLRGAPERFALTKD